MWNIKQSFPNQIIYISDDGKRVMDAITLIDAHELAYYSSFYYLSFHSRQSSSDRANFTSAVLNNTISSIFPTRITAVSGNFLTMKTIAMTSAFNNTLTKLGFHSYHSNSAIDDLAYNLYGEFLRNIMIPSTICIQTLTKRNTILCT